MRSSPQSFYQSIDRHEVSDRFDCLMDHCPVPNLQYRYCGQAGVVVAVCRRAATAAVVATVPISCIRRQMLFPYYYCYCRRQVRSVNGTEAMQVRVSYTYVLQSICERSAADAVETRSSPNDQSSSHPLRFPLAVPSKLQVCWKLSGQDDKLRRR